jgi:hypothetical protein
MSVLRGIALLARFRVEGFAEFRATPGGFLNSLAPMLAFPLVGGVILLIDGAVRDGLENIFASLVALLAPAVLSEFLALLWRRETLWLRYVIAYNWLQSLMTLLAVLLVGAMLSAIAAGSALISPLSLLTLVLTGYWLALCWFLISRGLGVVWWRAVGAVIFINLCTGVLVILPRLAAGIMVP